VILLFSRESTIVSGAPRQSQLHGTGGVVSDRLRLPAEMLAHRGVGAAIVGRGERIERLGVEPRRGCGGAGSGQLQCAADEGIASHVERAGWAGVADAYVVTCLI